MNVEVLSWVISAGSISATLLTYNDNPKLALYGPAIGIVLQPAWAVLGWATGATGIIVVAVFYLFIHAKGFKKFYGLSR